MLWIFSERYSFPLRFLLHLLELLNNALCEFIFPSSFRLIHFFFYNPIFSEVAKEQVCGHFTVSVRSAEARC